MFTKWNADYCPCSGDVFEGDRVTIQFNTANTTLVQEKYELRGDTNVEVPIEKIVTFRLGDAGIWFEISRTSSPQQSGRQCASS